jgi:predicted porin
MKKSLLAIAAMTAFASAAHAQSSVTVYGLYDGGYGKKQTTETSTSNTAVKAQSSGIGGSAASSSRLGLKGKEQINSDLSAMFNLELGITPGTGTVDTTTNTTATSQGGSPTGASVGSVRTSIVGLGSKKFGSIAVGRQLTGIHGVVAGNVFAGNNMVGDMVYSNFTGTSTNTVSGRVSAPMTRSSNMATYITPTIAGANLRVDWGNTTSTNSSAQPGIQYAIKGLTGSYTWGPITAKASTTVITGNEALTAANSFTNFKTTANAANIAYSGVKNLLVQYTFANNKSEDQAGTLVTSVRAQKLSASYTFGAFAPFVQYGMGNTQGARSVTAANTSTEDKAMQLGVVYTLSKRTNLYAAYGAQERKAVGTTAKTDIKQIAAGLRHTF